MPNSNDQKTVADLIKARDQWRATLQEDYADTSARLQQAYGRLLPELRTRLDDVVKTMQQADSSLTAEQIRGTKQYRDLIEGIEAEMKGFAQLTRDQSAGLADRASVAGAQSALSMAQAQVGAFKTALEQAFVQPNPDALRRLVDFVDGAALKGRVEAFGKAAADKFGDTFLTLVAQGYGPRAIAGKMSDWLMLPAGWADTQVRTAQIYSYRLANHASFAANPKIVPEWMWWAALDPNTCLSCISQHGSRHPSTETLNDHYRGRCAPLPIVVGTTWADDVQTGEQWFKEQPDAVQRQMMGPSLYSAYKAGKADFADFSHAVHDDVYGTMLRQATLKEMGIQQALSTPGGVSAPLPLPSAPLPAPQPPLPSPVPVSKALTVSTRMFRNESNHGLAMIDQVHTDGALPPLEIKAYPFSFPNEDAFGGYAYSGEKALGIDFNTTVLFSQREHVASTLTHEIGHFIDHQGIDVPGQWASLTSVSGMGVMSDWFDAVNQSPEIIKLREMYADPAKRVLDHPVYGQITVDEDYLSYALDPTEIWARSYAQYIAAKSADPNLTAEINNTRSSSLAIMQWDDNSFTAVAEAIDRLFQAKGWLK